MNIIYIINVLDILYFMVTNKVITKEIISDLVVRSYGIAKSHGFHDEVRSVGHYLMLVLSEVGEMVEADRKSRHADLHAFMRFSDAIAFDDNFKTCIKDTFEDEMADVVIRLCDFCGAMGVLPFDTNEMVTMSEEFLSLYGNSSVCEQCFALSHLIVDISDTDYEVGNDESCIDFMNRIGSAMCFVFEMANRQGIDLLRHVELKMRYNEGRPSKHGKNY